MERGPTEFPQSPGFPNKFTEATFNTQFSQKQNGAIPALPGGVFGHWRWGVPYTYPRPVGIPDGRWGTHATNCVYYIGSSDPMASGAGVGSENIYFGSGKGIDGAFYDQYNDNFYHKIGTGGHKKGKIHFTVNTYAPNRPTLVPNSFRMPIARFYYRQPTPENLNPNWTLLRRDQEINQVGVAGNSNSPTNDGPTPIIDYYAYPPANYAIYNAFATIINNEDQRPVFVQTQRAFDFDKLFDFSLGQTPEESLGIEYAITLTGQLQAYPASDAQIGNLGIVRSYVVADDLNFPTCAVWQNKNLYTLNGSQPNKLFRYDTSTTGIDGFTEWRYIGDPAQSTHTYRYARSPYGDYVTELYTDATSNVLFIPAAENQAYLNIKLNRGNLTPLPFQYQNLISTDMYGNNDPGQVTIGQDIQFNVGLDPDKADGTTGTGKKMPSSLSGPGVSAVRVFDPNNPNPAVPNTNDPQNYLTKGTLRVFKPTNP